MLHQVVNQMMDSLNLDDNVRIKSQEGNSRDRELDEGIMKKHKSGERLTKAETERARRQIQIMLNSKEQIPDNFIKTARKYSNALEGCDNKKIIHINTSETSSGSRARKKASSDSSKAPPSQSLHHHLHFHHYHRHRHRLLHLCPQLQHHQTEEENMVGLQNVTRRGGFFPRLQQHQHHRHRHRHRHLHLCPQLQHLVEGEVMPELHHGMPEAASYLRQKINK